MEDKCPVCLLTYTERGNSPYDSMSNHGYEDGCDHYVCIDCLMKMDDKGLHTCPICRGDISPLMETLYVTDGEEA